MRFVVAAVLASTLGVAHADAIVVEHYTNPETEEPDSWPPGAAPMLVAVNVGGGLLTLGGFIYALGDRSGWSAAAVWTSLPLLAVGPSIVHFYSGDYVVGAAGVAANVTAFTMFGLAMHHHDVLVTRNPPAGPYDARSNVETFGAMALWFGASVFEVIDSWRVTRPYRERLKLRPTGTGLAVIGQF